MGLLHSLLGAVGLASAGQVRTAQKRAERSLRISEARYSRLLSLLPAAVYSCEAPSGAITFFNQQAAKLWGRSPRLGHADDRFCGSHRLFQPDGSFVPHEFCPMALALREGRSFRNHEAVIARADGTRIDVRSASRMGDHDFGTNAARIRRFLDEVSNLALAVK